MPYHDFTSLDRTKIIGTPTLCEIKSFHIEKSHYYISILQIYYTYLNPYARIFKKLFLETKNEHSCVKLTMQRGCYPIPVR